MRKKTFKLTLGLISFIAATYLYTAQSNENGMTELTLCKHRSPGKS